MDAALPRFTIAESSTKVKHDYSIFLRRPHSDPEPAYSLQHADPSAESSRNCYAAGLTDAYNSQVLFGEVLLQPKWTQPTLSAEAIRLNNGITPPPEPIMPTDFTIQLYNPDQQVLVAQKSGALLGSTKWEFSMPQDVFRQPSASILDRSQDDPIADATTPRVNFVWKRENKFSKELTCFVTGKSTDLSGKKKSKEPDIAIATFKGLKDITIYEPNLNRVDMEDPKGLEVVLLLCAAVLRDVFFGRDIHAVFNITEVMRRGSAGKQSPVLAAPLMANSHAAVGGLYGQPQRAPNTLGQTPHNATSQSAQTSRPAPPVANPRTQWEIEAETARLEAEERARRKEEESRRRSRQRAEEEETRRLRRMVEKEDQERRAREKQVEEETRRLRKIYGVHGQSPPAVMSGANNRPQVQNSVAVHQPQLQPTLAPQNWQQGPQQASQQQFVPNSQYQQRFNYPPRDPNVPAISTTNGLTGHTLDPSGNLRNWRRSFLNLKPTDEGSGSNKLEKKRSSVF